MNMKKLLLFLGLVTQAVLPNEIEQKHIVIVTASYKNANVYKWNLDSVFAQEYDNWTLLYIDDCSPDNTANLAYSYILDRGFAHKVAFVANQIRCGAMHNHYFAIHQLCKPTDIVIILDGDDRFAHSQVLSRINHVYADGTTWLTYGQFREYPSGVMGFCSPMPDHVVANNAFRDHESIPSHLRTFYAGLFQKIKLGDLMHEGEFFVMCPDIAAMFPMIEMARDHFKFIPEVLLDYNAVNPISEHRISKVLQRTLDLKLRAMPRYEKIESPF